MLSNIVAIITNHKHHQQGASQSTGASPLILVQPRVCGAAVLTKHFLSVMALKSCHFNNVRANWTHIQRP